MAAGGAQGGACLGLCSNARSRRKQPPARPPLARALTCPGCRSWSRPPRRTQGPAPPPANKPTAAGQRRSTWAGGAAAGVPPCLPGCTQAAGCAPSARFWLGPLAASSSAPETPHLDLLQGVVVSRGGHHQHINPGQLGATLQDAEEANEKKGRLSWGVRGSATLAVTETGKSTGCERCWPAGRPRRRRQRCPPAPAAPTAAAGRQRHQQS